MAQKHRSPYLTDQNRLSDVIAAIQAMSLNQFYELGFAEWGDVIEGDAKKADHWKKVFKDHPEFFRIDPDGKTAILIWRRQNERRYDIDRGITISAYEFEQLSEEKKKKISRAPLRSDQITALIETATHLHSNELEHKIETKMSFMLPPKVLCRGS